MTEAYPLQWPAGWPRTPEHERSEGYQFKQAGGQYGRTLVTFANARDKLYSELERLGARNPIVSTNHKPDKYGIPTERSRVEDHGVAIYFQLKGKPMAMACDRYHGAAANMRSLGLAIEAMRQLDRHGGGEMVERAFTGFAALPAPITAGAPYWSVLGCSADATLEELEQKFKQLARENHPDAGGSSDKMSALNVAIKEAREALGK